MQLHPFTEKHLDQAGEIALAHWGDSLPELSTGLRPLIYQYLVRYYYVPGSTLSFGVSDDDGKLCGMLLAAPATEHNPHSYDWMLKQLEPEDHDSFHNYKAYLDGNRDKELRHARPREVVLSFFASVQRGCGRMLMQAFESACRSQGYDSMLLWTDDTCDFTYYYHNGFEEVAKLKTDPAPANCNLTTYLFRKRIA